jgi:hypothetical protein
MRELANPSEMKAIRRGDVFSSLLGGFPHEQNPEVQEPFISREGRVRWRWSGLFVKHHKPRELHQIIVLITRLVVQIASRVDEHWDSPDLKRDTIFCKKPPLFFSEQHPRTSRMTFPLIIVPSFYWDTRGPVNGHKGHNYSTLSLHQPRPRFRETQGFETSIAVAFSRFNRLSREGSHS